MTDELAELSASAATALVSAMGTDLWQEAKRLMISILSHGGGRRKELSAALERPTAPSGGPGAAEAVDYWAEALAQLLGRDPALVQPARALALLGGARSGTAVQVNSATGSGPVYAVQHGTQHIVSVAKPRDPEERR